MLSSLSLLPVTANLVYNTFQVTASTGEVVAEFTSTVERALRSNLFPVWRIARDVRDEERQFLLLILLYSETKRLERED